MIHSKFFLPFILIFPLLLTTACNDRSPAGSGSADAGGMGSGAGSSVGTITAFLDTIVQDWEGQSAFTQAYRELTGIELKIIQPPHQQYMNKLFIQIATGDLPDVSEILPEYLPQFVTDSVAVPLDEYIARGRYIGSVRKEEIEALRYGDGKIYGLQTREGGGCVTYIREDWLRNLGLEIPRTWDELVAVMEAFTYRDPDGDGVRNTWGYTDVNAASQDWYNRMIMQDARVEVYEKEGLFIDGFTEPEMVQALERLVFLYNSGFIDKDFINNTTYSARAKVFNGQAGIFTYWANHWAINLYERTKSGDVEAARMVPMPPIEGAEYINRIGPLLIITKGAEDPEFVFRNFIDLQYDKGPVQTLFTYGVKGFHWDMVNGDMQFLVNEEDPYKVKFTKAYVPPDSVLNDYPLPMPLDPLVLNAQGILKKHGNQELLKIGGPFYSKYFLEIEQELKPEIITKIVTGELSIPEGLEQYRRESQLLFIREILQELNRRGA